MLGRTAQPTLLISRNRIRVDVPMRTRLLIIFILGFSSGLPLALLTSTLQAWFADSGLSVLTIGSLSLVGIPYVYRMLWAPFLDRYTLFSMGKRRGWIVLMQGLLLIGFNVMAWLSPLESPKLMTALAMLLATFSATQDIAIDAQRTEYLPLKEHGIGASLAVVAYRIALLVSGGLALIIAEHFGWASAYRSIGALMIIGMIAALWSKEPDQEIPTTGPISISFLAPFKELISRPGVGLLFGFVFFYKLGEAFTTTTSGIVMPFLIQGLGFSLSTIAYVNKIAGVCAILAGGLVAGVLLLRWSLYRALLVFGLLQALTNALFILLAVVGKNLFVFSLAVICDNFAAGMASTALVAYFMQLVDKRFTATQFSILIAFSTLPRILSGPIAAMLQALLGWVGLYIIAFLLAFVFLLFLKKIPIKDAGQKHLTEP